MGTCSVIDLNLVSNFSRILIETDSPVYMRKYKRTAEPSDVTLTAKSLASLKGCSLEKVAEETSRNAEYIFDLNS